MMRLDYLAYLDPVSGSTLFQLTVAGLFSVLATVRLYWARIRDMFRKDKAPAGEASSQRVDE